MLAIALEHHAMPPRRAACNPCPPRASASPLSGTGESLLDGLELAASPSPVICRSPSPHPRRGGEKRKPPPQQDQSSMPASVTSDDPLVVPPESSSTPTSRLLRDKRRLGPEPKTRALRPRSQIPPPPSLVPGPVVYSVGMGFRSDELVDLEERVASLHRNPELCDLCRSISATAEYFLTLAHSVTTGWGFVAKREVPAGIDICYYSGVIRKKLHALGSNHCIDLGDTLGSPLVVDGCPPDPGLARPGSMQLVSHVCRVDKSGGLEARTARLAAS